MQNTRGRQARPASLLLLGAALLLSLLVAKAHPAAAADASTDSPTISASIAEPWRAIWIVRDRLATPAKTRAAIRAAAALGATDLFVQIRGRGDALYHSDLLPPPPMLADVVVKRAGTVDSLRWDPLAVAIEEAHAAHLRLHAWCNVYLVWSDRDVDAARGGPPRGHVLREHPDWAAILDDGRSLAALPAAEWRARNLEGVFLDPTRAEVRAHLVAAVDELVSRYAIDGLHWDYVRAPRAGLQADDDSLRESISTFVREAATAARARRPDLALSAAVYPDPSEAEREVRQEWVRWLAQGWIDRAVPMAYTASLSRLDDWTRREREAGAPLDRVVMGLGAYRLDREALRAELDWAGAQGVAGVSLFSLDQLERDPALAEEVRRRWRASPPGMLAAP
ncbi:MAG: family 10 glycosylhydrolase [Candidatus Eisenbacteria bacterium]